MHICHATVGCRKARSCRAWLSDTTCRSRERSRLERDLDCYCSSSLRELLIAPILDLTDDRILVRPKLTLCCRSKRCKTLVDVVLVPRKSFSCLLVHSRHRVEVFVDERNIELIK